MFCFVFGLFVLVFAFHIRCLPHLSHGKVCWLWLPRWGDSVGVFLCQTPDVRFPDFPSLGQLGVPREESSLLLEALHPVISHRGGGGRRGQYINFHLISVCHYGTSAPSYV